MSYQNVTFNPKKHTRYVPINEDKYIGNDYPVARSSWEYKYMQWCDTNPNIIKWGSESIQIPYYDPVKKANRRYYPDFTMAVKDVDGNIKKYVVEIKPEKETIPPNTKGNKRDRTVMYEFLTWQTNLAKWKAAEIFCRQHGLTFRILTEKDLFIDNKKKDK